MESTPRSRLEGQEGGMGGPTNGPPPYKQPQLQVPGPPETDASPKTSQSLRAAPTPVLSAQPCSSPLGTTEWQ